MNFVDAAKLAEEACEVKVSVDTPTATLDCAAFNVSIAANLELTASPGVRRECVVHVTQAPSTFTPAADPCPWLKVFELAGDEHLVEPFDRGLTIR